MWKKIQNNESVIVTILFNTCSLPIQQVTFQLNWRLYLVFQTILFKLGPLNVKLQYLKKKKTSKNYWLPRFFFMSMISTTAVFLIPKSFLIIPPPQKKHTHKTKTGIEASHVTMGSVKC